MAGTGFLPEGAAYADGSYMLVTRVEETTKSVYLPRHNLLYEEEIGETKQNKSTAWCTE